MEYRRIGGYRVVQKHVKDNLLLFLPWSRHDDLQQNCCFYRNLAQTCSLKQEPSAVSPCQELASVSQVCRKRRDLPGKQGERYEEISVSSHHVPDRSD